MSRIAPVASREWARWAQLSPARVSQPADSIVEERFLHSLEGGLVDLVVKVLGPPKEVAFRGVAAPAPVDRDAGPDEPE
eukprot:4880235-Pyramimonas_sp.AAC.1